MEGEVCLESKVRGQEWCSLLCKRDDEFMVATARSRGVSHGRRPENGKHETRGRDNFPRLTSMTCFSEPGPSSSGFYVAFKTVLQARAECPNHVPF